MRTALNNAFTGENDIFSVERGSAKLIHGGEEELARYINHDTSKAKIAYYQRVVALDATAAADHNPNRTKKDSTRFMAVVPLPYLDLSSGITHIGLACQGCKFAPRMKYPRNSSSLIYRGNETYTRGYFQAFQELLGCAGTVEGTSKDGLFNKKFVG